MTFMQRNAAIWHSYRSLPLWVQIWVGLILVPVNTGWLLVWGTPIATAAFLAAMFVVATNLPIMYFYSGMNRLMSAPHLIAWIPLQILIAMRLWGDDSELHAGHGEYQYGIVLFTVNGISLAFDILDSWRWLRGERETPGDENNPGKP